MPTAIEWTDETLNPIASGEGGAYGRWSCAKISPGCDFCYASRMNIRYGGPEFPHDDRNLILPSGATHGAIAQLELKTDRLIKAIRWTKPKRIFVCDMTDLFGRWINDAWIDQVIAMAAAAPQHTFQILTKRADRMAKYFTAPKLRPRIAKAADKLQTLAKLQTNPANNSRWPLDNLWLGVSIEDRHHSYRANYLRHCHHHAGVLFISAEPLLDDISTNLNLDNIDWLIVGGESGGPKERQLDYSTKGHWVRNLQLLATQHNTAFFFKQWGGSQPHSNGSTLDGQQHKAFPK